MSWFSRWRQEHHLRKYGRLLYPKLREFYGGGAEFTEAQIRNAAAAAGLSPRYIAFGLAMFMPEPEFEKLGASVRAVSYGDRRANVAAAMGFGAAVDPVWRNPDFFSGSDFSGDAGGGGDFGAGDGGGGGGDSS